MTPRILSESILSLARDLIRIPSQGGIDNPVSILHFLRDWFASHGVDSELLTDGEGRIVALAAVSPGNGPIHLMNCCIDTAAIGSRESWSVDPFGAEVKDGLLYGRGSGDSKTGVSLFSHLFLAFRGRSKKRRLAVLFDGDEHTGAFGGVKAFIRRYPETSSACIGYPGQDELVTGARGFFRGMITLKGTAGHTGLPSDNQDSALLKGARLVSFLQEKWESFAFQHDEAFPFGPSLTFTELHSGTAYSVIPDKATVNFDMRLTRTFRAEEARQFIFENCRKLFPDAELDFPESWPAYTLEADHNLVKTLSGAIAETLGHEVPGIYCGPSNIGNYLAGKGIPATCGFGVICNNFHAADEHIVIDTIEPAYRAYYRFLEEYLV